MKQNKNKNILLSLYKLILYQDKIYKLNKEKKYYEKKLKKYSKEDKEYKNLAKKLEIIDNDLSKLEERSKYFTKLTAEKYAEDLKDFLDIEEKNEELKNKSILVRGIENTKSFIHKLKDINFKNIKENFLRRLFLGRYILTNELKETGDLAKDLFFDDTPFRLEHKSLQQIRDLVLLLIVGSTLVSPLGPFDDFIILFLNKTLKILGIDNVSSIEVIRNTLDTLKKQVEIELKQQNSEHGTNISDNEEEKINKNSKEIIQTVLEV